MKKARSLLMGAFVAIAVVNSACNVDGKGRQMKGIDFDTTGWSLISSTADKEQWTDKEGDSVTVSYGPNEDPDLSAPKQELLRKQFSKQISAGGGAIIELDVIENNTGPVVQWIQKNPQKPSGMTYTGTLAFPRPHGKIYTVVIVAKEQGDTGARDSFVLAKLFQSGTIKPDPKTGNIGGWSENVCDPEDKSQLQRNKSEDPKYDTAFPDHPLSRVRRSLEQIRSSAKFGE